MQWSFFSNYSICDQGQKQALNYLSMRIMCFNIFHLDRLHHMKYKYCDNLTHLHYIQEAFLGRILSSNHLTNIYQAK